jgi:hypothetical protein
MTAGPYQEFLGFFARCDKARLDGLGDSDFASMSPEERGRAFDFLLERVATGGSEESVNGLFAADGHRAIEPVRRLLARGVLRADAQIAAAANLYRVDRDAALLPVFIRYLADPDAELRAMAARYVPVDRFTVDLKQALQTMILAETDLPASVHAVNALLACYEVTRTSVDKQTFSRLYRGLRSDDVATRADTYRQLDSLYD